MLTGKKIVLGVSGGIAAYKMANVASMLSKLHADIHVVMTENATHFITPETFEVLTGNHCYTDNLTVAWNCMYRISRSARRRMQS